MGVSGSGKSSIGQMLAAALAVPFIDADDHHPESNIQKMSSGIPLDDVDRWPWLATINQLAKDTTDSGCVIACSALKEVYRLRLMDSIEPKVCWVFLKGTFEQILDRMNNRKDHFMGANMLRSQFETLEEPDTVLTIDITDSPAVIVQRIKSHLE